MQLDSIDTNSLNKRNLALYAILKTQADYKLYRDIPTDSVIRIATDYYGFGRKDYHAAMAWYSLGCINEINGHSLEALDNYLNAHFLFPDTLSRYYALCYQNAGSIYVNHMNFRQAESALQKCLNHPACKDDLRMYYSCLYNLGLNALYSENIAYADSLFSLIINDPFALDAYVRRSSFEKLVLSPYKGIDADSIIKSIGDYQRRWVTDSYNGVLLSIKADAFMQSGNIDSAYHYYRESTLNTDEIYTLCSNAKSLTLLSSSLGRSTETSQWFMNYIEMRDSITEQEMRNEIQELKHRHESDQAERELKYRHIQFVLISISIIVILTMFLLLVFLHEKQRMARIFFEKKERLSELELSVKNASIKLLEDQVHKLSEINPEANNVIIELYSQRLKSGISRFKETEEWISFVSATSYPLHTDQSKRILNAAKECFYDTIVDFKKEMPNEAEDDIITVLLYYMNCSYENISGLFNISADAIRKRKSRFLARQPERIKKTLGSLSIG